MNQKTSIMMFAPKRVRPKPGRILLILTLLILVYALGTVKPQPLIAFKEYPQKENKSQHQRMSMD